MRLIDVKTLKLKDFFGPCMPSYATLSHRWIPDEEVTFQDWELLEKHREQSPSETAGRTSATAAKAAAIVNKAGYAKIKNACRRAQDDGLDYLWCDTNCIDKTSSTELSEAINSMYNWYYDSKVCYAYLADPGSFAKSEWFRRGWTLQELLTPPNVHFFDHRWARLGDRRELSDRISKITRIHTGVLHDRTTTRNYSVAQRMSWAAGRKTTRSEDIAYCLLGIFEINMPLLYGEKENAFQRLQQDIIKVSRDQSIFAWDLLDDARKHPWSGALALSPTAFRHCGSIVKSSHTATPHSVTNAGVSITLLIIKTSMYGVILAALDCSFELRGPVQQINDHGGVRRSTHQRRVYICLKSLGNNVYERTHLPAAKTKKFCY
ncbi:heterokaryon incompatibility protein-domain-containing protein [Xylariaceae sp. FL0804]|nr:heterokaryon incompatibility protein-domain-containing protein [Xylariaceae sp. FL0804]